MENQFLKQLKYLFEQKMPELKEIDWYCCIVIGCTTKEIERILVRQCNENNILPFKIKRKQRLAFYKFSLYFTKECKTLFEHPFFNKHLDLFNYVPNTNFRT